MVSVKVNDNSILSSGFFQLAIEGNSLNGEDFQSLARSEFITWDSSPEDFKYALSSLHLDVKEVRRCDQPGTTIGDSFGDWVYGCPYAPVGGYRWLIVFNIPVIDSLPTLFLYRNNLDKASVVVSHIKRSTINPAFCYNGICKFNITNLSQSTPYSFRYRGYLELSGWTEYSSTSDYHLTNQKKVPSRPQPPILSSLESNNDEVLNALISLPLSIEGVHRILIQYRICGGKFWSDGPPKSIDSFKNSIVISLDNLKPKSIVGFRFPELIGTNFFCNDFFDKDKDFNSILKSLPKLLSTP
jgi:hypothetical protein